MYKELTSKINWLSKNLPPSILSTFDKKICIELEAQVEKGTIYPGTIPSISVDINYSIFKNSQWTHLQLFQQLMKEFLVADYGLEPEACGTLIEQLILTTHRLTGVNEDDKCFSQEKDFFRYLYVCSSTSNPDTNLIQKFGLGSQVLNKIKAAIQLVSTRSTESNTPYDMGFIPEFEAIFIEVIEELAKELEHQPLAIDFHKLNYSLFDLNDNQNEIVQELTLNNIFKILLNIGNSQSAYTSQIEKNNSEISKDMIHRCLDLLKVRDLIFIEEVSKTKDTKWKLTNDSYDITGLAFAQDFLSTSSSLDNLSKFHHLYQHAVIHRINKNGTHLLIEFAQRDKADPQTIEAIVNKVHTNMDSASAIDLACNLINHSKNSWTRRAACKALSTWSEQNHIRQIYKKVAESDPVTQVREVALGFIINREAT